MRALKKCTFVLLVSGAFFCWNSFASAGQTSAPSKVQENRKHLIETNSCPGCDLSGVNLDRVNLTGANLEGANLSQARLHLATLAKASLRNTDLKGAMFGGADLSEADLRGADLKGATFVGAYLVGIKLDNESALQQSSEELVAENVPAQKVVTAEAVPVQEEQPPLMEKREAQKDLATTNQASELPKSKDAASSNDPGFFDNALNSVKGLFGQAEDDTQAVTKKADESGKSEKVVPEELTAVPAESEKNAVADNVVAVKGGQPAEAKENQAAIPSNEKDVFDKTLENVKGMFGQGGTETQAVTKNKDESGNSAKVIQEESPAVQAESEKVAVADIAPAPAPKPETAEAMENKTDNSASDTGFIDKTMESVKGFFSQKESVTPETVAVKTNAAATPAETVQSSVETVSAGPMASDKPDSTAEIEKNKQRLLDAHRCYGCNLTGVDLTGKKLSEFDLEGADLTGSRLEGADLEKANLKGAVLVRADLRNADLRGADLYKANLTGADLTGAKLDDALLDDAQLSDVKGYERKAGQ